MLAPSVMTCADGAHGVVFHGVDSAQRAYYSADGGDLLLSLNTSPVWCMCEGPPCTCQGPDLSQCPLPTSCYPDDGLCSAGLEASE
jgi:hypothetical protein